MEWDRKKRVIRAVVFPFVRLRSTKLNCFTIEGWQRMSSSESSSCTVQNKNGVTKSNVQSRGSPTDAQDTTCSSALAMCYSGCYQGMTLHLPVLLSDGYVSLPVIIATELVFFVCKSKSWQILLMYPILAWLSSAGCQIMMRHGVTVCTKFALPGSQAQIQFFG